MSRLLRLLNDLRRGASLLDRRLRLWFHLFVVVLDDDGTDIRLHFSVFLDWDLRLDVDGALVLRELLGKQHVIDGLVWLNV